MHHLGSLVRVGCSAQPTQLCRLLKTYVMIAHMQQNLIRAYSNSAGWALDMLRWVTLTSLLEVGCLEDRNMSFMPADLAAAEREAGWGIGRGVDATGLAG